jgi:hypothetical protein
MSGGKGVGIEKFGKALPRHQIHRQRRPVEFGLDDGVRALHNPAILISGRVGHFSAQGDCLSRSRIFAGLAYLWPAP